MEDRQTQVAPFQVRLRYVSEIRSVDADLIFEFFMVYSRFEFALKQAGYRRIERDGHVAPDWRAFSAQVQDRFDPNKPDELKQAFGYYIFHPPKIQVEVDGQLTWSKNSKREAETEFVWVIRSIGVVRNNLFHGGKFPYDIVRDRNLLYHGLVILYTILELDEDINRTFNY